MPRVLSARLPIAYDIYVLLRGSVSYGQGYSLQHIEVGSAFGEVELSGISLRYYIRTGIQLKNMMIISKQTYKAEEDCELIRLDWDTCKEVLIKPAKDEFVHRIKLIKDCMYIKEIDPFGAVILSFLGSINAFGYGEIIIRQGITIRDHI